MTDAQIMVLELGSKGYSCAQILLSGGLRLMGRDNPDLIRAVSGLAQGGGCSGEICGALSGGLCLLGLYCGKGTDVETADERALMLMDALVSWFREEECLGGGITCDAILGGGAVAMDPQRCGLLVAHVWEKTLTLLQEHGIDPMQGRDAL